MPWSKYVIQPILPSLYATQHTANKCCHLYYCQTGASGLPLLKTTSAVNALNRR